MSKSQRAYEESLPDILARIGQKVGFDVKLFRQYGVTRRNECKWVTVEIPNPNGYMMSNGDPYYRYNAGGFYQFAVANAKTASPAATLVDLVTIFSISHFPGSCAMGVSHGAHVVEPYCNRGVNQLGLELRIAIAGASKYTALLCSDIIQNEWSIKGIERAGFNVIHKLTNRRTNNEINVYIKDL